MKLRIVGWTDYNLHEFKEGENNWAVRMVVIDEIRKNNYLFSGYDHQERDNCAPVFNDGKMRRFSQRGFAGIMAEAHNNNSYMGYSLYMFGLDPTQCQFPQNEVFKGDFQVEKNLSETFVLQVDEQFFANAPIVEHFNDGNTSYTKKKIVMFDLPQLRYIEKGDTLVLTCNGKSSAFGILDVKRDRGPNSKKLLNSIDTHNSWETPKKYNKSIKQFMALPVVITLQVKQLRKYKLDNWKIVYSHNLILK